MRHHTKDKGDLGVFKAQVDLAQQGYTILYPLTEHADFDLVAYKQQRFIRIQVKYRSIRNGIIPIKFRTSWADKNGSHDQRIDKDNIDLFCIYCPDTDQCYYIEPNMFNDSLNLRVDMPRNNQRKGIYFAADYRRVP